MVLYYLLLSTLLLTTSFAQDDTVTLDDLLDGYFNKKPDLDDLLSPPWTFHTTSTSTATPTITSSTEQNAQKSCGPNRVCVPRYLCKSDTIVSDGTDIINIRVGAGNECNYLSVCCNMEEISSQPRVAPVPNVQHIGCGYRNANGIGFRISGDMDNEAQFGEFPWIVAILREMFDHETYQLYECGGSIIAPNIILTAAHCVQNRKSNELLIRAGEWDTQTKDEVLPDQDRRVREIIVHERYSRGSLHNDIALLLLETPFEMEENVRPICLPPAGSNFDNARCFAAGWGKNKYGQNGEYQVILKKTEVPVMPHALCQTNLRTTRLRPTFNLHESFLCAGGEKDKDTCKGDGGSPLMCPVSGEADRFYQAGIVAWGIGCGLENIPGVYANIANLRAWIDGKLALHGIDHSYFTA